MTEFASRTLRALVAGIAALALVTGCTATNLTNTRALVRNKLNDPAQCLEIVVESEPSGASVFGIANPGLNLLQASRPGVYLGKTPLTLRYARAGGTVFGHHPDETLDLKESDTTPHRNAHAYVAFRCILLKNGFEEQVIENIIEDRELDITPMGRARAESLNGGKRVQVKTKLVAAKVTHAKLVQSRPTPAPVAQPTTNGVRVESTPVGAEVYVDGEFVGNAPCVLPLSAGKYLIDVTHTGYKTFSRKLRVFKETTATVKATLNKLSK